MRPFDDQPAVRRHAAIGGGAADLLQERMLGTGERHENEQSKPKLGVN
jgi:hypothetical protein